MRRQETEGKRHQSSKGKDGQDSSLQIKGPIFLLQPYRVGSRKEEGVAPLKLSGRSIYNQSAVNFSFFIDILSTNYCYLPTYLHLYLYRISYTYYIIYSIYLANAMFIVSLFFTFNIFGNGIHLKITWAQQQS